jgi:hypothetical protein
LKNTSNLLHYFNEIKQHPKMILPPNNNLQN